MFLFSYSACSKHWEGSFKAAGGCRFPQPKPGTLAHAWAAGDAPFAGPLALGLRLLGCSARYVCSFRLLIEILNGGFHWILCVAWGEGQPTKQNKGKHQVDAEHMQIDFHKTTVLLFASFFTDTRSHSHFAYSSNCVDPYIFPAFLQLEVLNFFLSIWLLFLLPFCPTKHLDSFNKSSFIINITYAALPAWGITQKSSPSSHFLLSFPVSFLT